jgi:hypothetical protein
MLKATKPGQACRVALAARSCPRVDTGDRLATQLCLTVFYHILRKLTNRRTSHDHCHSLRHDLQAFTPSSWTPNLPKSRRLSSSCWRLPCTRLASLNHETHPSLRQPFDKLRTRLSTSDGLRASERPRKARPAFVAFVFWCSLSRALNLLAIGIHVLNSTMAHFTVVRLMLLSDVSVGSCVSECG